MPWMVNHPALWLRKILSCYLKFKRRYRFYFNLSGWINITQSDLICNCLNIYVLLERSYLNTFSLLNRLMESGRIILVQWYLWQIFAWSQWGRIVPHKVLYRYRACLVSGMSEAYRTINCQFKCESMEVGLMNWISS